ncbi:Multidrug resistance regulator 1 [Madurella mycetomatis]|uniref:Multidrug resistance regulator 1 n=1 Tax=Madurella mycetomatis TaxID=100816 RepID=A0A175WFE2_9PEZI|nr:Multidrug resistance regulator 1 [Madurella mycetomatis]KXX82547.1 Multidrug resistance regulator 1 [Madurella mycetomatis]
MSPTSPDDGPPPASADWADAAEKKDRPPPRKRRRIVISCTECHRRKQRCDRKLPCANCVSRNKQSVCRYETGAPTARQHDKHSTTRRATTSPDDLNDTSKPALPDNNDDSNNSNKNGNNNNKNLPTFGYTPAVASASNTLTFLSCIDGAHPDAQPLTTTMHGPSPSSSSNPSSQRYKSLIRQLPARRHITSLAAIYFHHFNWQYYALDAATFHGQLEQWYRIPFATLAHPDQLPTEMRAFPGLVFQMLAVALLVVEGTDDEEELAGLKYAGGMSFEDLAGEYSDVGMEVLAVLGKRGMGVNNVLAGWVRASVLKYLGLVTESWHAIGSAIRDAQEIGLHRDALDPKPEGDSVEAVLENQWEIQRRRRVWMTLVVWDMHMACVLGRPTTTNLSAAPASPPVDTPEPKDKSKTPVLPRGGDEPPTPLTRAIWGHHLVALLQEIMEMEKEGPCPRDFGRVDKVHNDVLGLEARMPAYFRLENPDTRFDALPECYWLPLSRVIMPQLSSFTLMALHRSYIFTRPKSRTEALKASLAMLHAQRLHFLALKPQMYKTFSLFFGTFDAIVLMASIYILFPKEHLDLVQKALQHFQWAVERFEAMSARNSLAKAALGVLHAIYLRLKKSLGLSGQAVQAILASAAHSSSSPPDGTSNGGVGKHGLSSNPLQLWDSASFQLSPSTGSTRLPAEDGFPTQPPQTGHAIPHRDSGLSNGNRSSCALTSGTTPDFFSDTNTISSGGGGGGEGSGVFDLNLPNDFDWASLQPIHPTGDLIFNDLAGSFSLCPQGADGVDNKNFDLTAGGPVEAGMVNEMQICPMTRALAMSEQLPPLQGFCQFEGCFGDDSVWNLLNQYAPL